MAQNIVTVYSIVARQCVAVCCFFSLLFRCVKELVNISVAEAAGDTHGKTMFTAAHSMGLKR